MTVEISIIKEEIKSIYELSKDHPELQILLCYHIEIIQELYINLFHMKKKDINLLNMVKDLINIIFKNEKCWKDNNNIPSLIKVIIRPILYYYEVQKVFLLQIMNTSPNIMEKNKDLISSIVANDAYSENNLSIISKERNFDSFSNSSLRNSSSIKLHDEKYD